MAAGEWRNNAIFPLLPTAWYRAGHSLPCEGKGIGFSKQRVNLAWEAYVRSGEKCIRSPLEILNLPHLGRYKSRFTDSAILLALAITVKVMGVAGIEGKTDESTRCTLLQENGLPK